MKHATIPALGILMIELPKGAKVFQKHNGTFKVIDANRNQLYFEVPPYEYSYLAPFEEMSEEKFKQIVMKIGEVESTVFYLKYTDGNSWCWNARESFLSAVEASGYYFENPIYDYYNSNNEKNRALYEQAQSRTFEPALTHVFKIEK